MAGVKKDDRSFHGRPNGHRGKGHSSVGSPTREKVRNPISKIERYMHRRKYREWVAA